MLDLYCQVRKSSVASYTSAGLVSPVPSDLCPQAIPEVLAHTPQGTVLQWEQLFDVSVNTGTVISC